jgi:hypothetical protein
VVPVPPLDQGVLNPGVPRIAFEDAHGQFERIDHVQHRHRHKRRDVKPDGHVEVPFPSLENGHEHVEPKHHPHQRDCDVNGPLQFGVFFGRGEAQGERKCRRNDDELPPPKIDATQRVGPHARLQQPLHGIVHPRENAVPHKGENDGVRVQRPDAAKRQPRKVGIEFRPHELRGHGQADEHAHEPPKHGGEGEIPHDGVVVVKDLFVHGSRVSSEEGNRIGGVTMSSNCPSCSAHKKPNKKPMATMAAAAISKGRTPMVKVFGQRTCGGVPPRKTSVSRCEMGN